METYANKRTMIDKLIILNSKFAKFRPILAQTLFLWSLNYFSSVLFALKSFQNPTFQKTLFNQIDINFFLNLEACYAGSRTFLRE